MPKVRRPGPFNPPERGGRQDGKKKVRKLSKSPCSHPPAAPTGVRVLFHVAEAKTELEYTTVAHWNEVDEDSHGFPVRSSRYYVQCRPCRANGEPIEWIDQGQAGWQEWDGNPNLTRKQLLEKRTVDKPKDGDPDDWAHVSFGPTRRPKAWHYQARVRAEDTEGCKGEWSPWSEPANALDVQAQRPRPPTPTGLLLSFSAIEKARWDRYVASVEMNEVGRWDIPGGDHQDDVSDYVCQLQGGRGINGPWDGKVRTMVRPARDADNDTKVEFIFAAKIRKHRWYRARARTRDRFNRRGEWSEWTTAGSPSDNNPPPNPLNVVAIGSHNHVGIDWRKPDHPDDAELPHPDIAYAQAQLASSSSFSASSILAFDKMIAASKKEWETDRYRRRYWMRVRFIDGSDNKGNWVQAGPVRPQKVGGQRVVVGSTTTREAEIDYGDMIGGVSNRAYRPVAGLAMRGIDGESVAGTLTMRLQAARTASFVSVGAVMRWVDANNYLIVRLREGSGIDGLQIIARVGGVETVRRDTTTAFTIRTSQVYDMRSEITAGGFVTVYLDDIQRTSYQLTATEIAAIDGKTHGIYFGANDDGTSRIEDIAFTPEGETVPTIDDGFTRTASAAALGIADSGQQWVNLGGTIGISPDSVPDGLMSDLWASGDSNQFNNISIPSSGHRKVGEGGPSSQGVEIEIDRPTRFNAQGSSTILNADAEDFKCLLFLVAVDDTTGQEYLGKAGRVFTNLNDASSDRPRHVTAQHDLFVPCNPGQTKIVRWWWGYRRGGTASGLAHIGPQSMMIQWVHAEDLVDGTGGRLTRPAHTKSSITIARYRRQQPNE